MKLQPKAALAFIVGGNALFTIRKPETGGRFTYKVEAPRDQKHDKLETPTIYFVKVLTGSDNTSDYTYIGYIRGNKFTYGTKSHIKEDAPSVQVFTTVFNRMLMAGQWSDKIEIWHEGCCGRCGRTLTVPESIETGFGPECVKHINYTTKNSESWPMAS